MSVSQNAGNVTLGERATFKIHYQLKLYTSKKLSKNLAKGLKIGI